MAGVASDAASSRVMALYNGKLDAPRLWGAALNDADCASLHGGGALPGALAHWDFAAGITRDGIGTDAVCDVSGHGYHGRCLNQPDRGMTGWNWTDAKSTSSIVPRNTAPDAVRRQPRPQPLAKAAMLTIPADCRAAPTP